MKISDPGAAVLRAAAAGDLAALDTVLLAIQPGVFNLAVRMLGNREDAADASQEILLRVVTHLGGFRGEAAFPTWVFQIARNQLLSAATRSKESPEVSLESIAERLQQGLDHAAALLAPAGAARALTPEDKAEARELALGCTQSMLMALDRGQRLAYVLDVIFGLSSRQAAEVLDLAPDAYRQRLARARARLQAFGGATCGHVNRDAACQCERQMPAVRHLRASGAGAPGAIPLHTIHRLEQEQASRQFDALLRMGDAAALFRAHPEYQAPDKLRAAIRTVLRAEGYLADDKKSH